MSLPAAVVKTDGSSVRRRRVSKGETRLMSVLLFFNDIRVVRARTDVTVAAF